MGLNSKIRTGSFWLGLRFLVSGLLGAISMPLIARLLSVEEYGIYNVLLAVSSWIGILTGFGLPNIFQRFIPEALEKKDYGLIKTLVKRGLLLRLLLSLVAIVIVAMLSGVIGDSFKIIGWEHYFLLFSFCIICMLEVGLFRTVFDGLFLQKYAVISNLCWSMIRVGLLCLIIIWGKGLLGVLLVETISWAVWLSMQVLFYYKHFLAEHRQTIGVELENKRFLRYGGFSFFSEVGTSVLDMATDLFIITIFLGPAAAGVYGFCDRVMKLFRQILPHAILRNIIQPVFFTLYSKTKDLDVLGKMFNFHMKIAALFLFPLTIGVCVLGDEFIFYIFGDKYLPAYLPLCIVVSFFAVNVFGEPTGLVLQALEKVNILFYSKIFAVYNLIGDLLVIEPFGIVGVAAVTSSAGLFKNLFCLYYAKKYAGIEIQVINLLKIGVNAAVMGLFCYLVKPYINGLFSFVLTVLIGSVFYLVICSLNKAFAEEERGFVNKIFPRKIFVF